MNELQMFRNIHDGLHGLIRFTKEETEVINHPLFQRLRWICQTGLLKLVCPTATHTRFEHSLGTVHMAQQMLDALHRESQIISCKLYGIPDARPGQAIRFEDLPHATLASMQRVLRICALVHDLGHGPLSHAFESFMPKTRDMARLLHDRRLSALAPVKADLLRGARGRLVHEAVSCILFTIMWHDLDGEPWIPRAVSSVLLGSDPGVVDAVLRPFIPLIRDMVSSAPVDADRMDYLLRDSHATGVCYGLYEPHRVLKSILCVQHDPDAYRLGWRFSGLRAVESFVLARFQMYVQMYYHKTNHAISLMLEEIGRRAERSAGTLIDTKTLDGFIGTYGSLSDEMFLRTLRGDMRPGFPADARISGLADQILCRRLWKQISEFDEDEPDPEGFMAMMRGRHPERIFMLGRLPIKAMKDLERGACLLSLDGQRKYSRPRRQRSWLQASALMRGLKEKEQSLVRLFMEMNGERKITSLVKEDALRIVAERDAQY